MYLLAARQFVQKEEPVSLFDWDKNNRTICELYLDTS
jgi:hypothetical protein